MGQSEAAGERFATLLVGLWWGETRHAQCRKAFGDPLPGERRRKTKRLQKTGTDKG